MLISFLKSVYCLIYFRCVIMLLIFFYSFYYIFHVCLFVIPNFFVSFFSFIVLLLFFLLRFFLLSTLFSYFLHFFYCKFAFLIVLLLNVSVPSSFSVSCCMVSLIIVLMFSHFSLILL